MDQVATLTMPVPSYDVRRLNKAVESYTTMGPEKALEYLQSLKLADFHPIIWTDEETAIFEQNLEKYGGLEAHATGKILGKRAAEVLRFSYMWKNKKLKTENELIRQHRKVHAAHARTNRGTLGPPSLGKIRSRAESETSDDEGSLYNASFVATNRMQCAACSTRTSNVWWKCPRTVQGNAMCESCGSNYRKYGVISFAKAEDAKRPEKKELKGRRGVKGDTASGASTPVPMSAPKLPPCACCRKMEPKAQMARCKTCTFSAHAGCYGIAPQSMGPNWECELCANISTEESNLEPRCVLCPRDNSALVSRTNTKGKKVPADFDFLAALKPTEGCRWAHILCSAWTPEVQYAHGATFRPVEGISTIPAARWEASCTLCGQADGSKIQCNDCSTWVHPSCAYIAGYRFGFEFQLVKPTGGRWARDNITIARFKDEAGVMTPGCWCKGHDLDGRAIYDMFEVDPDQGENALQIYSSLYKTIPATEGFPLLRKAQRLDRFIEVEEDKAPAPAKATAHRSCSDCGIGVSPRWHGTGAATQCHQCWFLAHERAQAAAPVALAA